MPPQLIGQLIDRYKVVAHLQDERWGSLYKAYDPKLTRTVILQILDPQWARQDDHGSYAQQVARAALRWRHTGVQRVYDLLQAPAGDVFGAINGVTNGAINGAAMADVIVAEFLPGHHLGRLLQNLRGQGLWLLLSEAVDIVIEAANALNYLHPRGIVHGGLTSEQIAFRPEPIQGLPFQPVLTGLGFTPPEFSPTASLPAIYQPPEARPGRRLDQFTDLYALAVILHQLVTGQLPGNGQRTPGTPFPSARTLHPGIPDALDKFLNKTLDDNPDNRYADAGAFASALAALQPRLEGISAAPIGMGQAVSLVSVYQQSLNDPLYGSLAGDSPLPETIPTPVDVSGDQIHLLTPDGNVESRFVSGPRISIGRGAENDLVIDRPGISRRHARIDFDGQRYMIIDLGSTNGTYLEDNRLPPEQPQVWAVGENLRIGDVWLRLERAGQGHTTQAVASNTRPGAFPAHPGRGLPETVAVFTAQDGTLLDTSMVRLSPDGLIGAYTDTPSLSVTPGSGVNLGLLLFNRGPRPDVLEITFEGLPLDWISNPPRPVGLPAEGQREVQVTFRPPRTSAGRAGRHLFNVRVASQNDPNQVTELRLTLTVTAFSQFFSELQPKVIQTGQVGQVIIHNRGNLPETYTVLFEDRFQEMVFDPPQLRLTVPPGKSAAVEYRPALLRPRWVGSESTHAYKTHVSAQTGQLASHSGEYISRGMIPLWAPAVLSFLCVVLACMALVFINQITSPSRAVRQTAEAGQTAVAQATQLVNLGATQTAALGAGDTLATLVAATQTAMTAADDDLDGLSNVAEAQAGTRPDNPDTDNDQLKDGDEVNTWKTNPLVPDTDGDGLTDGQEVQRGLNPLQPDSDEDGLPDGTDPDPLLPTTRTPIVVLTFTPPPATITLTPQVRSVDLSASISNGRTTLTPGQQVNYTILISNKGITPISGVQGSLAFPPSLTNVIWNCQATPGSSCLAPSGLGNINERLDLAPFGSATINVSALVSPSASGQVVVTFTVSPPLGVSEINPTDNQSSDVDSLPQQVNLTLTKTDNRDTIQPGQMTTYVIVVGNNGPSVVNGVNVVDNFSPQLESIQWVCSATIGSSCQVPAGVGNINLTVNLAAGGAATFTVNASLRGDASGVLNNTVSINSPINPAQNNRSASDTTQIVVPVPPSVTPTITPTISPTPVTPTPVTPTPVTPTPVTPTVAPVVQADLRLAVSVPGSVAATAPVTFTATILNAGPSPATGVTLDTMLPAGAVFIAYTITSTVPGPPPTWICSPQPGSVTCALGDLAPGGVITVELSVGAPMLPGNITQRFDIHAVEVDPNPADNQVDTTITVY